jgi:hypothetical protein
MSMIHAVMKVVGFMEEKGLTDEEKLKLLGSVARLKGDAVTIKGIFENEGLTEEEQRHAIRAIRAMIKPRKTPKPRENKGKASK